LTPLPKNLTDCFPGFSHTPLNPFFAFPAENTIYSCFDCSSPFCSPFLSLQAVPFSNVLFLVNGFCFSCSFQEDRTFFSSGWSYPPPHFFLFLIWSRASQLHLLPPGFCPFFLPFTHAVSYNFRTLLIRPNSLTLTFFLSFYPLIPPPNQNIETHSRQATV